MTGDKIKEVMDACYLAKRVRDMLPKLPNGVTSSHIHYLDTIRALECSKNSVRVSDISDELGLPRPNVTKPSKIWRSSDLSKRKPRRKMAESCLSVLPRRAKIWWTNT